MKNLAVQSHGLKSSMDILQPFLLPEWNLTRYSFFSRQDAIAGWGHKPSAAKARAIAARHNLPYIALEDGFLRSFGLGVQGVPPLSLIIDPVGIYYDATIPSMLENLLEYGGWETPQLLARAEAGISLLRQYRLSKYNCQPELSEHIFPPTAKPRVLLIDQTVGDASISLGLADDDSFQTMLTSARRDNPDADIIIKTHPDVIAGKKQGYLVGAQDIKDVQLFSESCTPWSLLERVDQVYTVTSQMGFEALMAGKSVRCFGMPFYAGWGLTRDEKICSRRHRRRSLPEIFAAAYLLYPRYQDPITRQQCEFERVADVLYAQKHNHDVRP